MRVPLNKVLWGFQSTVDWTYATKERTLDTVAAILERKIFEEIPPDPQGRKVVEILGTIKDSGLFRDYNIEIPDAYQHTLVALRKFLKDERQTPENGQMGGNPAVSALRGHRLRGSRDGDRLPSVGYVGLLPTSVKEYIDNRKKERPEFKDVFLHNNCIGIGCLPQTVTLEADRHKIMFVCGPGRRIENLKSGRPPSFNQYVAKLKKAASDVNGTVVVALSAPRNLAAGNELLESIRKSMGHAKVFMSASSFKERGLFKPEQAKDFADHILKNVDVFSCNEDELHDLHTALVGHGTFSDISLANKLKELPLRAIKVCHCAHGAILDVGVEPESIISSPEFRRDPGRFLEETLRLATDGATYTIDSLRDVGKNASAAMIQIYSGTVTHRSSELFSAMVLKSVERMPGGIIGACSPVVARPLTSITGVGAIFDGLFLSLLMRS